MSFETVFLKLSHFSMTMMTSSNGNIFRVTGPLCSPVNSPHKGQWRGALMFSLICAWINSWVNNQDAGDLRRHRTQYDVAVVTKLVPLLFILTPIGIFRSVWLASVFTTSCSSSVSWRYGGRRRTVAPGTWLPSNRKCLGWLQYSKYTPWGG